MYAGWYKRQQHMLWIMVYIVLIIALLATALIINAKKLKQFNILPNFKNTHIYISTYITTILIIY